MHAVPQWNEMAVLKKVQEVSERIAEPNQRRRLGMQTALIQSYQNVSSNHQLRDSRQRTQLDAHRSARNVERHVGSCRLEVVVRNRFWSWLGCARWRSWSRRHSAKRKKVLWRNE